MGFGGWGLPDESRSHVLTIRVRFRMFDLINQTIQMLDNFGPTMRTVPVRLFSS